MLDVLRDACTLVALEIRWVCLGLAIACIVIGATRALAGL